ncbi:hypothetical protein EMIT0P291_170059 [Pseudomonas sp. IT-P291]
MQMRYTSFLLVSAARPLKGARLLEHQSEAYQNRSLFEQNARQTVPNPAPGSTCLPG